VQAVTVPVYRQNHLPSMDVRGHPQMTQIPSISGLWLARIAGLQAGMPRCPLRGSARAWRSQAAGDLSTALAYSILCTAASLCGFGLEAMAQ
jgi:hypothetical protein